MDIKEELRKFSNIVVRIVVSIVLTYFVMFFEHFFDGDVLNDVYYAITGKSVYKIPDNIIKNYTLVFIAIYTTMIWVPIKKK